MSRVPISAHAAEKIESLRKSECIDYQGVAAVKQELLEQAFELFYRDHYLNQSARGKAFLEYVRTEGAPLEEFALFLALSEYMRNSHKASAWPEWPVKYRSPEGICRGHQEK